MRDFCGKHYIAILTALFVGFVYVMPQIFFIVSLGEDYKGIPMIQTPNEDSYLARIQDILDGHPALGSPFFFEYKDQWPIAPPVGEMFYVIPAFLLRVPAADILVASKFVLPSILFLLVYFLIYLITVEGEELNRKINAVAGSLFVTLGYDLVDYRHLWRLITDQIEIGGFLLWARPVNPILGAIFLFSFLLLVWTIIQKIKNKKLLTAVAAFFLALMMGSYFFSWGMALSIMAMLILIYFFKQDFQRVKDLIAVLLFGFLFAAPYWYLSWQASQSPWYESSLLRSGLFYTHYPLLNKLMLAVMVLYFTIVLFAIFRYSDKAASFRVRTAAYLWGWHWFCLALIFGSLLAYSQQIIIGRTVWPYHFVQYSIPLAIIIIMVTLYNILKKESLLLWKVSIFIITITSLFYGIYVQTSAYNKSYSYQEHRQSYAPLFDWFNSQEKDCVVLVKEGGLEGYDLNVLIPAFTHCNRYASSEVFSLMPDERPLDNYLAALRLRGVSSSGIDEYLSQNRNEATGYLYSNWQGLFGVDDFPDFSDLLLEERLKKFPEDYRQFMKKDFKSELNKYRLDYILSIDPLPQGIIDQLVGIESIFSSNNLFVYSLSK